MSIGGGFKLVIERRGWISTRGASVTGKIHFEIIDKRLASIRMMEAQRFLPLLAAMRKRIIQASKKDRSMKRSAHLISCLILALAVSVATSAKLKKANMRLPAELAQTERFAVEGRQGWRHLQRLEFGPYSVDNVVRSITKGGDLEILVYQGNKRRQSFGFTHKENGESVYRVGAATNLRRRAVRLDFDIELRNKSGFVAEIKSISNPEEIWRLELSETRERPLSGSLYYGSSSLKVIGTENLAGTPLPLDETSGYLFEMDNEPVAAVEVINDGAVWILPTIDDRYRSPVAAASSALLLFEELRKTLPE